MWIGTRPWVSTILEQELSSCFLDVHPEFRMQARFLWIPAVTLGSSAQAPRAADRAAAIIIYFLLNWSACDCRRNVAIVERVRRAFDDGAEQLRPPLPARKYTVTRAGGKWIMSG
jgi:hypothetical protein